MRIFSPLYDRAMRWARHPHATWYLGGLSFAESSFFPIPPDVMLAPMSLANPAKAWWFAGVTTLMSVVGGAFGYLIGMLAFDLVEPLMQRAGYWPKFLQAKSWFDQWGFWAVLLAGFSPIPYKIFTVTAGVIAMSFPPFLLASIVGRGSRFFMVAALMAWGGERMEGALRRYIDRVGWILVAVVVLIFLVYRD